MDNDKNKKKIPQDGTYKKPSLKKLFSKPKIEERGSFTDMIKGTAGCSCSCS